MPEPVGTCECGATLMRKRAWYALPRAERVALRRDGWREHHARGLCTACYQRHTANGTLVDYERRSVPRDCLLDDWAMLRDDGFSLRDAAARLGVSVAALDRALCRALRRGDPRGHRRPFGGAA